MVNAAILYWYIVYGSRKFIVRIGLKLKRASCTIPDSESSTLMLYPMIIPFCSLGEGGNHSSVAAVEVIDDVIMSIGGLEGTRTIKGIINPIH